jgi:hypothetical protein
MDLQLDKRYPLQASPAQAWALLADLPATAACMPGAQITEQVDATHYRGQVRARIGPAQLSFEGEIELLGLDAAAQSLAFNAKGADKAGSAASMQLQARIEPEGEGASALVGTATVRVSGKLAQIGNRLLLPASEALLAQFAANFNAAAQAREAQRPAPPAEPAPALNLFALIWATLKNLFRRSA